jgi:hypothetical protein
VVAERSIPVIISTPVRPRLDGAELRPGFSVVEGRDAFCGSSCCKV